MSITCLLQPRFLTMIRAVFDVISFGVYLVLGVLFLFFIVFSAVRDTSVDYKNVTKVVPVLHVYISFAPIK